jgi:hypothetical protein
MVLYTNGTPSVEGVILGRTAAMSTSILFRSVGNKPRWIWFADVYGPRRTDRLRATVNSITSPNDKNRDQRQVGIECTYPH